jgi:hypothetical protein
MCEIDKTTVLGVVGGFLQVFAFRDSGWGIAPAGGNNAGSGRGAVQSAAVRDGPVMLKMKRCPLLLQ